MNIINPLIGLLMLLHPHLGHPIHPMIDPGAAEACFVQQTNATRASKGLSTLPLSSALSDQARGHSAVMASSNSLYHSTGAQYPGDWTDLGENVGVGPTCDDIQAAFLASPHHYANIVDPKWTTMGVGVSLSPDGNTIWVTVGFEAFAQAAPVPAPVPAPAPVLGRAPPPAPAPASVPVRTAPAPLPVRTSVAPLPVRTTAAPVKQATPVPIKTTPAPVQASAAPVPITALPPVATPVPEPTATVTPTAAVPLTGTVALPVTAQSLVAAQTTRGFLGLAAALILCLGVGGVWGIRDRRRR